MNYTVIWVDEELCLHMDHVAATCVDAAIRAAAGEHGREVLDLGDTIVLEGWHDDLTPRCSACGDVLIGGDCPSCAARERVDFAIAALESGMSEEEFRRRKNEILG